MRNLFLRNLFLRNPFLRDILLENVLLPRLQRRPSQPSTSVSSGHLGLSLAHIVLIQKNVHSLLTLPPLRLHAHSAPVSEPVRISRILAMFPLRTAQPLPRQLLACLVLDLLAVQVLTSTVPGQSSALQAPLLMAFLYIKLNLQRSNPPHPKQAVSE